MSVNHDTWKPGWVRGSKLEEMVWITNNVLAWCSGIYIVFFDVKEEKFSCRWCWNNDSGEGARCLSTHVKFPVFAFAEKIIQPRIIVVSYPSMMKICECQNGSPSGYLATAFTAQDHLVSLGFYPKFPMIIWNWRTGEKIISVNTKIRDEVGQILRITQLGPIVIGQMGKTCGRLFTWELDISGKVAVLRDYEVKLHQEQEIRWIDWCPTSSKPLLAIADYYGHVYLCNHDGTNVHRIVLSQRCSVCPDYEVPIVCWFRDGIILRTTFCQLRYYSKNVRNDSWRREWYVKVLATPYMLVVYPSDNSRFFYYTTAGCLMQVEYTGENQNPNITTFMNYGAMYKFADFVYPWCHHLAVTDSLKELSILECYSGKLLANTDLDLDGEITCQVSHPDYPLIVLGTTDGKVIFVSLSNALTPTVVASLRLQREPVNLVKFSYSGRFLIAAEKSSGNCYCINLHRTKVYTVQTLIQVQRPIADLLFYDTSKKLRLLVLVVSVVQYNLGQQVQLFEVLENQNLVTESVQILDLPGAYRTITYMIGDSTAFLGSPYNTRQLRLQKVRDFKEVVFTDGVATGHQVKLANIFVNRFWIATTALDGLVFVRDKNIRRSSVCVMSHHRADLGNVKAMMNKSGDLIVCLGYDGSLVALRSSGADFKKIEATSHIPPYTYKVDHTLYEKLKKKIRSDYVNLDPTVYELLTRPKLEFPDPNLGDKTWVEWREEMQILQEEIQSREEKAQILQDFQILKGKVKKLLDENEVCPEIERLPVFQFNLDKIGRDQTLKAGRDECEDLRLRLEHDINEMKRVSEWIQKTYWDTQRVLGTSLVAIFDKGHVTNYALSVEEPYSQDHFEWACFCKEILTTIVESETFRPWNFYTKEELEEELHKKIKLKCEEEERIDLMFEDEEEDEEVEVKTKKDVTLEGTTTHLYVESSPYYSQLEFYGFHQMMVNNRLIRHDCVKLRMYFNQAFDKMYRDKEREMNIIRDRIDRIRYIDSELRTMFGRRVSRVPTNPQWYWQEKPDGIIKVLDHEVKAKRYISPSMQELLDKQAAEAERIRQLLLADDFRERALLAMMDGVLEVRWEDIIKLDIPKPAFMLEKKPDDYTAEEILLAKQYEKDVQFLQEERERYNRMLDAECIKVATLLNEGIERFNTKLNELFRLKIKIESAINQLNLRYVRSRVQVYERAKALQQEEKSKIEIAEMQEYKDRLKSDLQIFQNVHQQTIAKQDMLIQRQKTLEKKFKTEFSSLSKLNQDLLERQYKRRPKTNLKNLRYSELEDLSEYALKKTRAIHLPSECNDYLRALDHLDVRPATLPPTIDTVHWDHLIRLRRQKVGLEIKMRAKYVEILHTESIILELERRIEKCRLDIEGMNRDFEEYRAVRNINELNVEVQLVMKMGQLEIDTRGEVKGTRNAIIVCQTEIEAVNELIRAAGACKLKALARLLNFQKGTLTKQWQHECDRKRLQDMQEDFRFVESMMVTKEMQSYLKRKARGMKDDKTQQQLAQYVNMMTQRFKKVLEEHQERYHSIQSEILNIREKNTELDEQILKMNVARCEMELSRDLIGETREQEHADKKLKMIMKRALLIKKLQDNYADLLELQTEHELLRIRRYPTFNFKILDGQDEPNDDFPSHIDFCPC